jgi:hypothetical protein
MTRAGIKSKVNLHGYVRPELRHIKCYRSEEEEKAKKGSLRHNRCYRKEASKYGAEIESGILGGDTIQVFEGMSSRQDADTGGIL